jgi:hypothetical protein
LYQQEKTYSQQSSVEGLRELSENDAELSSDPETEEAAEKLHNYLLTIVRLSITCPFRDVRKTFKDFLRKLKVCGTLTLVRFNSP